MATGPGGGGGRDAYGSGEDDGGVARRERSQLERRKSDGSTFHGGIDALTDVGLTYRASRELIVGRMKNMCAVRLEQKKFAASLEEEILQLEQGRVQGGVHGGVHIHYGEQSRPRPWQCPHSTQSILTAPTHT
jgi:hypothetical protein